MALMMGNLHQALVEDIRTDLAFVKALSSVAVAGIVSLVVNAFFL